MKKRIYIYQYKLNDKLAIKFFSAKSEDNMKRSFRKVLVHILFVLLWKISLSNPIEWVASIDESHLNQQSAVQNIAIQRTAPPKNTSLYGSHKNDAYNCSSQVLLTEPWLDFGPAAKIKGQGKPLGKMGTEKSWFDLLCYTKCRKVLKKKCQCILRKEGKQGIYPNGCKKNYSLGKSNAPKRCFWVRCKQFAACWK